MLLRMVFVFVTGMTVTAGCTPGQGWDFGGQQRGSQDAPAENEVYRLVCAFQPPFWKNYRPERSGAIEGFKFNLYLISRKTNRGVLTSGTLQTRMYLRKPGEDGSPQRVEACSWTQSLEDTPRTVREFEIGWGYQPHYFWGDLDLAGQEVEIIIWYETPAGRKVYAAPRFLKVPARG